MKKFVWVIILCLVALAGYVPQSYAQAQVRSACDAVRRGSAAGRAEEKGKASELEREQAAAAEAAKSCIARAGKDLQDSIPSIPGIANKIDQMVNKASNRVCRLISKPAQDVNRKSKDAQDRVLKGVNEQVGRQSRGVLGGDSPVEVTRGQPVSPGSGKSEQSTWGQVLCVLGGC